MPGTPVHDIAERAVEAARPAEHVRRSDEERPSLANQLLLLQQLVGNRAVAELLEIGSAADSTVETGAAAVGDVPADDATTVGETDTDVHTDADSTEGGVDAAARIAEVPGAPANDGAPASEGAVDTDAERSAAGLSATSEPDDAMAPPSLVAPAAIDGDVAAGPEDETPSAIAIDGVEIDEVAGGDGGEGAGGAGGDARGADGESGNAEIAEIEGVEADGAETESGEGEAGEGEAGEGEAGEGESGDGEGEGGEGHGDDGEGEGEEGHGDDGGDGEGGEVDAGGAEAGDGRELEGGPGGVAPDIGVGSGRVASRAEARAALAAPPRPRPAPRPFSAASDPGVRSWGDGVRAATGAIAEPDLAEVRASPDRVRSGAAEIDTRRRADRPDAVAEAHEAMPAPPETEEPLPAPPPDPVPAATELMEAARARRLPDQSLPVAERSPIVDDPERGIHIEGLLPGESPPAPTPAPVTAPGTDSGAPASPGTAEPRPDMEGAAEGAAGEVVPEETTASAPAAVTLTDAGPPSAEPAPPELQADLGEVIATLLSRADTTAQRFVDAAMDQAFGRGVLAGVAPELGADASGPLTDEIRTELRGVGEAAGLEADALDARAAEMRRVADEAAAAAETGLAEAGTEAAATTEARSTEEQTEIAGAAATNELEITQRREAATGQADEAAVEAEAEQRIAVVRQAGAEIRANLRLATETRERELTAAETRLASGYRTTGTEQSREIRAAYERLATASAADAGDAAEPTESADTGAAGHRLAGIRAALPTMAWSRRNQAALTDAVAELRRELTRVNREQGDAIRSDEDSAVEMVRAWRDERLGEERSWWERLLDLFTDWGDRASASTEAWARVRDQGSRDRAVEDFQLLADARDAIASGNQARIAAVGEGVDAAQRAVLQTYFSSGGNAVAAVSAGMLTRLGERRIPEMTEQLRNAAEGLDDWRQLEELGQTQGPFNAQELAIEVHAGVDGAGTDEDRIYRALGGRTRIQLAAIRGAYAALGYGSIDDDLTDDFGDGELDRARQLMAGDQTGAEVAELRVAMEGGGTDEAAIMRVLRNKTPEERAELIRRYEEMYPGSELEADLRDDLGDTQLEQAEALLAGDRERADALALREAMGGVGTDEDAISGVYSQIRQEVEAEAARTGMSTAEVEAEIRRRNGEVAAQYGSLENEGPEALTEAFRDDLSDGELALAEAYATGDQTAVDAAIIRVEQRALFDTDDDRIVGVLRHQRERAEMEAERDLRNEWQVESSTEGWSPAEARAHWDSAYQTRVDAEADRQAGENMRALEDIYDEQYGSAWGPGALQVVVAFSMGGEDQDVARDLIRQNGRLTPVQEIEYALNGAGTDEEAIRRMLRDPRTGRLKSREEIDRIRAEYEAVHGEGSFRGDIIGELSGREEFDIGDMLEGEPRTPEERDARLRAREQFDRGESLDATDLALGAVFPAYGLYQMSSGAGLGQHFAGEEGRALDRSMEWAGAAYDEYEAVLAGRDPTDPAVQADPAVRAALARFERRVGGAGAAIEDNRRAVDSVADTMSTVAGVAAGIAVAVATAGTATPAVVAAAAAVAATAATVTVKTAMLGRAYGVEALGTDLAVGGVDVAAAVLTAGVGNAMLRAGALARLAERGIVSRVATQAFVEGVEGTMGAIPSGMAQVMLDDNTWRHPNPMLVIAEAAGQAGGMGFVMSAGMSVGGEAIGGLRGDVGASGRGEGATADPIGVVVRESDIPPEAGGHNPITSEAVSTGETVGVVDGPAHGTSSAEGIAPVERRAPGAEGPTAETEVHVGEDGIVDLDDPRNAHLIDGMAGSLPGAAAFDPVQAREFYEGFVSANPGLESALLRNTATGEFMIFQGNAAEVGFSSLDEAVRDLVPATRSASGRWVLDSHSHPVDAGGTTPDFNRLPSIGDLHGAAVEADIRGGAASEELRFQTETGAETARFGYDPGSSEPILVEIPGPDGSRTPRRFATIDDYHDWYEGHFGFSPGEIPADFPGPRRADAEVTGVFRRPDLDADEEVTGQFRRPDLDADEEVTRQFRRPDLDAEPTLPSGTGEVPPGKRRASGGDTPRPGDEAPTGGGVGDGPPSDLSDFDLPEDLTFESMGPLVEIPTGRGGERASVLEVGAGPSDTNLGLPVEPGQGDMSVHDSGLIDVTRTDLRPREGVVELDASQPIPPDLRNQDTVIINNPRGYTPDVATIGEALRPGGRMIIQGRAEVVKGMRGVNPDMNRVLRAVQAGDIPPGYRVVEVVTLPGVAGGDPAVVPRPSDVMGGPFGRTAGGPVSWPNTRIVIERLPVTPGAEGGPPIPGSGPTGEGGPPPTGAPEDALVSDAGSRAGQASTQSPVQIDATGDLGTMRLLHGTDQAGLAGMGALGEGQISARAGAPREDFGQGFYLTVDPAAAQTYADVRARQHGEGGMRHVLQFDVPVVDLGTAVDIRPEGPHRTQWEAFLDQSPFPGVPAMDREGFRTIREFLGGYGVEQRGAYFERFLQSIDMTDADTIIGPLGDASTTGITGGTQTTQVCVRSQTVADRLNAIIRGEPPAADGGQPAR